MMHSLMISWLRMKSGASMEKKASSRARRRLPQTLLARKKIGAMPSRKKQMTDNMVKLVARTMEESSKVRKNVKGTLGDIRDKAMGMAAFTQAEMRSLDDQALRWEDVLEDLWTEAEVLFKK